MHRFAIALLALSTLAGVAAAQYDESSLLGQYAYANGQGTSTGFAGDAVTFYDAGHSNLSSHTIGWWCDRYFAGDPRVSNVVFHSGGQISIRFNLFLISNVAGGSWAIRRNGRIIDNDPIY